MWVGCSTLFVCVDCSTWLVCGFVVGLASMWLGYNSLLICGWAVVPCLYVWTVPPGLYVAGL